MAQAPSDADVLALFRDTRSSRVADAMIEARNRTHSSFREIYIGLHDIDTQARGHKRPSRYTPGVGCTNRMHSDVAGREGTYELRQLQHEQR
jgi:hypothetical protein